MDRRSAFSSEQESVSGKNNSVLESKFYKFDRNGVFKGWRSESGGVRRTLLSTSRKEYSGLSFVHF